MVHGLVKFDKDGNMDEESGNRFLIDGGSEGFNG
jgi:hypothetical protein